MTRPLHELGAIEALSALAAAEIDAERYTAALIARCEAHSDLRAFISLDPAAIQDAARASDAARARARARTGGGAIGSLEGLPIAVKDNIHVAGTATTAGTPSLAGHRPPADAEIVAILRRAGAIPFGKANLHELCGGFSSVNAAYGAVENPYARDRIAGGSSGGSAASVSARLVPVSLGTDTAGSLRIPAALCGVVGFRPTTGRYPSAGIVPLSPTRDTPGVIARSAADVALLDGVIAGDPAPISSVELRGLRLGVPRARFHEGLEDGVAEVIARALEQLSDRGAVLVEVDLSPIADCAPRCRPIIDREIAVSLRRYLQESGAGVTIDELFRRAASPDVKRLIDAPFIAEDGRVSDEAYTHAMNHERPAVQAAYARCFAEHGIAALIQPTTPGAARRIEDASGPVYGRNTTPSSIAGIPGLSVPAGLTAGLPVGIEVQGKAGEDRALLAIGVAIERALGAVPAPEIDP